MAMRNLGPMTIGFVRELWKGSQCAAVMLLISLWHHRQVVVQAKPMDRYWNLNGSVFRKEFPRSRLPTEHSRSKIESLRAPEVLSPRLLYCIYSPLSMAQLYSASSPVFISSRLFISYNLLSRSSPIFRIQDPYPLPYGRLQLFLQSSGCRSRNGSTGVGISWRFRRRFKVPWEAQPSAVPLF